MALQLDALRLDRAHVPAHIIPHITKTAWLGGGADMPELTDRFCQTAKPKTGLQAEFFDTVVKGLSLVASKGGTKTFYLTYSRPADGKRARMKLGRYAGQGSRESQRRACRNQRRK